MDAQTGCLGIVLAVMFAIGAFFVVGGSTETNVLSPTPAPMLIETPAPTP